MSRDLTEALRAMMAEDSNTNVVPALKPRGAAPAAKSSALLQSPPAKPSSGGGIAAPLTETSYASRLFWGQKTLSTSDGVWSVKIKPVKQVFFTDADSNPLSIIFADRP